MDTHRQHYHLVTRDELTQRWIGQRSIIKIGSQREQDDDRAVRLGDGGHQQIKEVTPLILRSRLGEEFLELVHQQNHSCPLSLYELRGEQVQTTRRVIFQVFPDRLQALVREVL